MKVNKEEWGKYRISVKKARELYYFCLQYGEWKEELSSKINSLKSGCGGKGIGDSTMALAIKRTILKDKCELIESTIVETDKDLYRYLLKAITEEGVTYQYLRSVMGMPCSRRKYYETRRRFYYLLSKKKENLMI
ncbi:hypothetical protein LSA36186_23660 [Lachnoanaerobaculum sp. JCM 36186]|uniref:hypothetical protein n=1 Tax=Lachnoanaerobaculum sanguinis TaxID=3065809 RepID=UPI0027724A7D|nr:hypothetical protein [Lachnoanaerobaculum sp. JCM 36186]GMO04116.1 hypothetical protein LSA36186_23660 [Lachnoanaerobaculum sp. JCM 36186]